MNQQCGQGRESSMRCHLRQGVCARHPIKERKQVGMLCVEHNGKAVQWQIISVKPTEKFLWRNSHLLEK